MKEMRRKDRQLQEDKAMEILMKGEYGILATVGEDYPYAVPLNYVLIDRAIYIHGTNECGQKYENMQKNSNVCFTVVGDTAVLAAKFSESYESVVVLGKAELVHGQEKIVALEEFINKYSSEYKESGFKYVQAAKDKVSIYKISIEEITGKARR